MLDLHLVEEGNCLKVLPLAVKKDKEIKLVFIPILLCLEQNRLRTIRTLSETLSCLPILLILKVNCPNIHVADPLRLLIMLENGIRFRKVHYDFLIDPPNEEIAICELS